MPRRLDPHATAKCLTTDGRTLSPAETRRGAPCLVGSHLGQTGDSHALSSGESRAHAEAPSSWSRAGANSGASMSCVAALPAARGSPPPGPQHAQTRRTHADHMDTSAPPPACSPHIFSATPPVIAHTCASRGPQTPGGSAATMRSFVACATDWRRRFRVRRSRPHSCCLPSQASRRQNARRQIRSRMRKSQRRPCASKAP